MIFFPKEHFELQLKCWTLSLVYLTFMPYKMCSSRGKNLGMRRILRDVISAPKKIMLGSSKGDFSMNKL